MKGVVAMVALGAALVLVGLGCGGSTSAFGHYRILVLGHGRGTGRIFLWRPGSPPTPLADGPYGVSGGGGFFSGMSDGAWSPDGRSIAFEEDLPGGLAPPNGLVYVMRSDGTHVKVVSADTNADNETDGGPSWSPDSRQIVYERQLENWDTGTTRQDFAIVDVRSGHWRSLSAGGLATGDYRWSKAGIAYASGSGIMLLNPETGRSRLVTRGFSSDPLAWSPGGVLAAVESTRIVLFAPSGRVLGKLPLPRAVRPVCDVAWSPDGKQILVSTTTDGTSLEGLWVGTVSTKHWQQLPAVPIWRKDKYDCAVSWR